MSTFDPSVTASHELGIFGIPATRQDSRLILLPVPWEVTTSYGGGAARGPQAILEASPQIDLFDLHVGRAYEAGYYLTPIPAELRELNDRMRPLALDVREELETNGQLSEKGLKHQKTVNGACEQMVRWVYREAKQVLEEGKLLGLIGGDHSTPLGAIQALTENFSGDFGILHLDAHADLRDAYQGFQYSHASIMNNVMNLELSPRRLVQVGIRDLCQEEFDLIQGNEKICTFFDRDIKDGLFRGRSWADTVAEIIAELPQKVYLSFDIDGLSPEFCPNTGTPVPGGLSFDQAVYLLNALVDSRRQIIGFDLNEVAPGENGEWDGNVGARLLYKMCGFCVRSQEAAAHR